MSREAVTFCRICEAACGLIASIDDAGRVSSLRPDPEHVVSRGYACVKGTRYTEVHSSPDRLSTPLKRVGQNFVPIGWDEALREIGDKARALREAHGRQSLGLYMGNPAAFSAPHPIFAAGFMRALGTRHLYTAGSQDCANKFAASWEMFGSPMIHPVPDLDHARCLIIIGSNPAISQMSFIHAPRPIERMKAIEAQGGKVVFVNPRRTESAAQVGEQLFIRPDTDVFFLLAFAHELFRRGAEDGRAAKYLENTSRLRGAVQAWTPERCGEVTGIAAEKLRELVGTYLEAGPSALYCSTGLNQGRHGTLAVWLLNAINAVSGNLDRRGGVLVPRGTLNLPLLGRLTGAGHKRHHSRIGNLPSMTDAMPGAVLADEILTPGHGQLRGLFVSAGNPLLSCPNGAKLREAFSKLELLVSIDLFRNETAQLAHYVLPVTSFLERGDIPLGAQGFQPTPYLQYAPPVVAATGEQRDEWWIFTRLADEIGVPMFRRRALHAYLAASARGTLSEAMAFDAEKLLGAMVRLGRETSLSELKRHPHGLLLADNREHDFLGKPTRVLRPFGRVDVAPAAFLAALPDLEHVYAEELSQRKRLKLITKRERTSHNSWMHNVESFVKPPRDTNYLFVSEGDAEELGLSNGVLAEIRSATGSVRAPVKVTDELMQGTVALPHGWGHEATAGLKVAQRTRGVNANVLSPDGPHSVEPLSGMSHLTGILVDVRKADADQDQDQESRAAQ